MEPVEDRGTTNTTTLLAATALAVFSLAFFNAASAAAVFMVGGFALAYSHAAYVRPLRTVRG